VADPDRYRYEIDYLNAALCAYLDRAVGEMGDHMREHAPDHPQLADRLRGYLEAIGDVRALFAPGHRVADTGMARILRAARQPEARRESR
jgi:hypothetical protein